jgi:hypothetical protein
LTKETWVKGNQGETVCMEKGYVGVLADMGRTEESSQVSIKVPCSTLTKAGLASNLWDPEQNENMGPFQNY